MKKSIVTLLSILGSSFLFGQNNLVKQWDHRFGGSAEEHVKCLLQTADGGFILGGISSSPMSGDKTQSDHGIGDYWIVKTDALGNMQWDKDFGGTNSDYLISMQQTTDGGYILGGTSLSGISVDKSQPNWDATEATNDYWIIKTDATGNKIWDKSFGGTDDDQLTTVIQTSDGGYILSGFSYSGMSGDKSQVSNGNTDYWIVKTDAQGNKLWDKTIGGSGFEYIYAMQQTSDGGYILGGYSNSGISGDKTSSNWDVGGTSTDYWIVKIDATGSILWDKSYGGTNGEDLKSITQTTDGGYIMGGNSVSGIGGDKSQNLWGGWDYWIVKTDAAGNLQWEKDFGGTAGEEFFKASQTNDGGYLLSGESYSPISGNKTESNLGQEQLWVIKTDQNANIEWDKTVLTTGHDESGFAIQTVDGCYAMTNLTAAGVGGYKTQPAWNNSYDYWLVKFCDSTSTMAINQIDINKSSMSVYPNPTNGALNITLKNKDNIVVTNVLGEIVLKKNFEYPANGKVELNVSLLAPGIYFIKAGNEVCKFVKE